MLSLVSVTVLSSTTLMSRVLLNPWPLWPRNSVVTLSRISPCLPIGSVARKAHSPCLKRKISWKVCSTAGHANILRCCQINRPVFATWYHNMVLRLHAPGQKSSLLLRSARSANCPKRAVSLALMFGVCVGFVSSHPVYAKAISDTGNEDVTSSTMVSSHGKKVYTDYSIIGIPGDGRCLFRSVAHGACIRSGRPAPTENLQKELADDLRARVADELVKRRAETEWFVEGDFDTYVAQIRKPHVWGGEPELFIASHVLEMPITVYMRDENAGGLIAIAEYGQEYGKENPIRVLYHGFGHYDAIQMYGPMERTSKL